MERGKPFFWKCEVNGEDDEEEELPRPETVTVEQGVLTEEADPLPSLNSDPLSVDPLSLEHSIEMSCKAIKAELDDESKVIVKIELSDSEGGISNATVGRVSEDEVCCSGRGVDVTKKTPANSHLRDACSSSKEAANKSNKKENGGDKRDISAQEAILKVKRKPQIDGTSEAQANGESTADLYCPEVESEIPDRFSDSGVEVPQTQVRRATKGKTVLCRLKVTSCPESDNSNTFENLFADTSQALTERTLKSSLSFFKSNAPKERLEGEKLLALFNVKRKLRVVLTRCKEAEMLVSSMTSGEQCGRKNSHVTGIHVSPKQMGENETNSVEDRSITTLEVKERADDDESDLVPGRECECETSVSRDEAIDGNAGNGFFKGSDEGSLAICNENFLGRCKCSVGEEYVAESTFGEMKTRRASTAEKSNCVFNTETSIILVNARVKTNESASEKKKKTDASHILTLNNARHIIEHSNRVKNIPESNEVITSKDESCHECSLCHKSFQGRSDLDVHLRTHSGERPYECFICHKSFSDRDSLFSHKRIHGRERPHECSVCHKRFSQRGNLVTHLRIHSGDSPHKCSVCHKRFSRRGSLVTHMRIHSGERPYECSDCQKKFSRKGDLVKHIRIHNGERPHECSVCCKRFSQIGNLVVHMRIHSGERPHECSICQKKCLRRGDLVRHMLIHNGKRPFECSVCQKKFSQRGNLVTHMRIHSENSPHECTVCHKRFRQRGNLVTHMRIHSGERPHECSVCQKKCSRRIDLVRHMLIHSGNCPFECSVCQKKCSQRSHLVAHMRTHSGERPFGCFTCHKKFSQKSNLVKHMRIHSGERPYECSVCQKKFSERGQLNMHMRIHSGELPYECSVCEKKFSVRCNLVTHMRIHSGERPYECSICQKKFSERGHLVTHIRIHSGERPYECSVCRKKFLERGQIVKHMRIHSGERP